MHSSPSALMALVACIAGLSIGNSAAKPSIEEAKLASDCFNGAFYEQYGTYGPSYKAKYWGNSLHSSDMNFWDGMEGIEVLIDAYEVHQDESIKTQIGYLYNGVRDRHGLTWENNTWNDDLMWGSLMCIRAYAIFNDGGMLTMAKDNFAISFNRGWDDVLGGGMYITTNRDSKTACVNTPGALAALFLYKATGETAYLDKAKLLMNWVRTHLFDANTGCVGGSMNLEGRVTEGARSYTQGTFIGACNELHNYFPDEGWLVSAQKAMDYTKNDWCDTAGLFPDEYDTWDCIGFKGIFARWACTFIANRDLAGTYGDWLDYNATQAWEHRNSNGVMWGKWAERAPDSLVSAWEASTGLSFITNVQRFQAATAVLADPVGKAAIAAETFTVVRNRASSTLTVRLPAKSEAGIMSISNIAGQTLKKVALNSHRATVDISDLPKGYYALRFEDTEFSLQTKLIID